MTPEQQARRRLRLARAEYVAAMSALRKLQRSEEPVAHWEVRAIQQIVCVYYGLPLPSMWNHSRQEPLVTARLIAIALAARLTSLHRSEICLAYGRTGSEVNHAMRAVSSRCATEATTLSDWNELYARCRQVLMERRAA